MAIETSPQPGVGRKGGLVFAILLALSFSHLLNDRKRWAFPIKAA